MTEGKQIKSTNWLTRGIPKEQLEREKREAIMSADLQECITYDEWSAREYGHTSIEFDVTAEKMVAKGYRKQSEWISVEERLPTHEENDRGLVGIVNGHNGKIGFMDAFIFVGYDFDECEWVSDEYDLANCKVDYWMVIHIPTKMKGDANSTHTEVSEDEQEI